MKSKLAQLPQFKLLTQYTSLYQATNLSKTISGPDIYIKRDDTNFIGVGGNKLRKLEFYIGDALANECDTIITMGAWQSNHAMLTAAAAAKAGLNCEIILAKKVPIKTSNYNNNGNMLLDKLLGVSIHTADSNEDLMAHALVRKKTLEQQGRKSYIIPMGGSSPIGCLGYVKCAGEIVTQAQQRNLNIDAIIVANGSSGTHAGLLAGFKILNSDIKIYGYNVFQNLENTLLKTENLANNTLKLLGCDEIIAKDDILLNDAFLGEGYGIPTSAMKDAIVLMAQLEGIFLDPVYTGKAFSGVLADIKENKFHQNQKIVFIHTGGVPGLFAYL